MIEAQRSNLHIEATAQESSYFLSSARKWGQLAKRPVEWFRSVCSPSKAPSITLGRISKAAEDGIKKAKIANLVLLDRAPELNASINQALAQRGIDPQAAQRSLEIGEVADANPLAPDREVTLVPKLQDRVAATNWTQKQTFFQEKFKNKLAVFATLCGMRDRAGFVDPNNFKIMSLVNLATEGSHPASVWQLFVNEYNPSYFQKIFAGWFYCIYYMTSLITNTIDAYLESSIKRLTEKLTTESDATRHQVFSEFVQQANDFLVQDLRATKRYAEGVEAGTLEEIRDREIEKHYDSSLLSLCEKFTSFLVEKDRPPKVRFFKELQSIPVLGLAFYLFEYLVNRFIIQKAMKNSILPMGLEKALNEGLKATQADQLPFSIAITKFFTEQLKKLQTVIDKDKGSAQTKDESFPGTGMLPPTIRLLIEALELEGEENTPDELKDKIAKKKGLFYKFFGGTDETILEGVKQGIIGAVNKSFWELNRSARSHELFANLMEIALSAFSDQGKTEEQLRGEYQEKLSEFYRTGESAFKSLIQNEISKIRRRKPADEAVKIGRDSLSIQKIVVHELSQKMSPVCLRIEEKIAASREAPTEMNNVQKDIAELMQILQVLSSRKELQSQKDELDSVHQNEIWNRLTPLYEKAEIMSAQLLKLQDHQHAYASHHSVISYLTEVRALLTTIQDEFHVQPRLSQHPLIQSLRRAADEAAKILGADAPISIKLRRIVDSTALYYANIAKEQSVIDAIQAICPPLRGSQGFIDQLLLFQQGHTIQGFQPRECLNKIAESLACFPPDEESQHEKRQIERIIGDGSNIRSKFGELGALLQSVYARHMRIKTQEKAQLDQLLNQSNTWLNEKIVVYQYVKADNHKKMREEISRIGLNVRSLQKQAAEISTSLTIPVSDGIYKTMALACPILGTFLGGWAAPALGIIGGAGFKWMSDSKEENDSFIRSTLKKAAKISAGVALSRYAPSWIANRLPEFKGHAPTWASNAFSSAAGYIPHSVIDKLSGLSFWQQGANAGAGVLAGATLFDWGNSGIEKKAFSKVWDIFNRAYKFSRHPRVAKAILTRTMKRISETS